MLVLTDSTKSTKVQNTEKMSSFDWIFFDCFNTLIDDFDDAGDESGVGFLAHLPVHAGFYSTSADFKQDYDKWRENQWSDGTWLEVTLPDRFRAVLVRNTTVTAYGTIILHQSSLVCKRSTSTGQTIGLDP